MEIETGASFLVEVLQVILIIWCVLLRLSPKLLLTTCL